MGWKSTMNITREDALQEIQDHLRSASDAALSEVLEDLVHDQEHNEDPLYGHNLSIVAGYGLVDWDIEYRHV